MSEPIYTRKNEYRGLNAHLQSILQTPGSEEEGPSEWSSFHANHIADITNALNRQLPDHYIARTEHSLQIRENLSPGQAQSSVTTRTPRPDITIYGSPGGTATATVAVAAEATWTYQLDLTLPEFDEDFVTGVVIRDISDSPRLGRVVTRIELLSPSNLPGHTHSALYKKNRQDAILSGTPLIELHYLHEYPVLIKEYPRTYPYVIFVNNPRPSVSEGLVAGYGIGVDVELPVVPIPLANDEKLDFKFGEVYDFSYEAGRWGKLVNYAELPPRINTYSQADRERIRQRMAAVAEAVKQN